MKASRFFSLSIVALLAIVIAGCGKSNQLPNQEPTPSPQEEFTTTPEAQIVADQRVIGNTVCDDYLELYQCIIDSNTASSQSFSQENYDSLVASFSDVPSDQLQAICTDLTESLQESLVDTQAAEICGLTDAPTNSGDVQ